MKRLNLFAGLATSMLAMVACSDFSTDLKGDSVLDFGSGANSILTCNAALDGKVVKPADSKDYRLCKDGQWFAVEIGDFNEVDIYKPTAKSSSSNGENSALHDKIYDDDPVVDLEKSSSSIAAIKPTSSATVTLPTSSSAREASSSSRTIIIIDFDDPYSSATVTPKSSTSVVPASSATVTPKSSASIVPESSSADMDPVEDLYICEDGKTIVVDMGNCPENQEPESSSSEKEIVESVPESSSETIVTNIAKLMPNGTYDCKEASCIPTNFLRQDFLEAGVYQEFLDTRDNQVYKAIQIGTQVWMAQNLNYNPDNDSIAENVHCYQDDADSCALFGRLYTWAAAMNKTEALCGTGTICKQEETLYQGICPNGWHLPSNKEWNILNDYVDANNGDDNVGTSLKIEDLWSFWTDELSRGNDRFGFSGIPVGRYDSGFFDFHTWDEYFWSSSEINDDEVWIAHIRYYSDDMANYEYEKRFGNSIRCVYDISFEEKSIQSSSSTDVTTSSSSKESLTSFIAPNGNSYSCGPVSSCWVMSINENSNMILDIAHGSFKTADYYIENIENGWKQINGSDLEDCPGWKDIPEEGVYRLIINNWTEYTSTSDMDLQWSEGIYGSVYAIDFWKKIDWSNTLEHVDSLPTTIFNCENLVLPPTFTSSVTGELTPYIEAMLAACPNIQGNGSLNACTEAADYKQAKAKYPDWFENVESKETKYDCSEYDCVTTEFLNQELLAAGKYGELLDERDGKVYRTIQIGEQTWMAQDLSYETPTGSWCYRQDESNCAIIGRAYTWNAALGNDNNSNPIIHGICPEGFHIPSDDEFLTLAQYVGGDMVSWTMEISSWGTVYGYEHAATALKSPMAWSEEGLTDDYGFSAVVAGVRWDYGGWTTTEAHDWWTSTDGTSSRKVTRNVNSKEEGDHPGLMGTHYDLWDYGFYIRCIQD